MKRSTTTWVLAGLAVACGLGPVALWAAPEPAKAPRSWELDIAYHDLERISLVLPGDRQPTTFWYLLYTVTNNSGRDVEYYPSFELVTDSLHVVIAGDEIHPAVYDAIEARHKKMYPFFRDPLHATGKLLQGPDNARTSAAVFRNFDPQANEITVYVGGLSGEVAKVGNPAFNADEPEAENNQPFFALRKTLGIRYDIPGDAKTRAAATPIRRGEEWVMR